MALAGTRNVTSIRLVAPAALRIAKYMQVRECGRQDREPDYGTPRRWSGRRDLPRLIETKRQRHHEDRRGADLPGGVRPSVSCPRSVGHRRRPRHSRGRRQGWRSLPPDGFSRCYLSRAHHQGDPCQACKDTGDLVRRSRLVGECRVSDQHGEERGCGVQNRCYGGGHMALGPQDE